MGRALNSPPTVNRRRSTAAAARIRLGLILLALLCAGPGLAWAQEARVRVHRDDDQLLLDWTLRAVFDAEVERSLRSGLPARLRVKVELWRDRTTFWDQHVLTQVLDHRILFDLLDERFEVIDESGERVLSRPELEEVEEVLGSESAFPLCPLDEISPERRFYVVLDVRVEPLSVEEIRDLERWLRGSLSSRSERSGFSGISRHLVGVLKSQVGLGEKRTVVRTPGFRTPDLRADDVEGRR
jgi:hypothetical protein